MLFYATLFFLSLYMILYIIWYRIVIIIIIIVIIKIKSSSKSNHHQIIIKIKIIIIKIIIYFENVAFFHAKLGLEVCPRVDNQTSGDTLQDLTRPLVEKSPSASYTPMGIEASFWWRDALPHQPVRIREETLESGNLLSGSWIPPPYPYMVQNR